MKRNYLATLFVFIAVIAIIAVNETMELEFVADYGFMLIIAAMLIGVGIAKNSFFKLFYK